jgi:hypothetical protein
MTPVAEAYLTYLRAQCNQNLPKTPFMVTDCLKCQQKILYCCLFAQIWLQDLFIVCRIKLP